MAIHVRFSPALTGATGTGSVDVEPGFRTVGELLDGLLEMFPPLREELLDSDGRLDYVYQVLVNGEGINRLDGMGTLVRDGDEVVFLVVLGGGGG